MPPSLCGKQKETTKEFIARQNELSRVVFDTKMREEEGKRLERDLETRLLQLKNANAKLDAELARLEAEF